MDALYERNKWWVLVGKSYNFFGGKIGPFFGQCKTRQKNKGLFFVLKKCQNKIAKLGG